ncbi:MAG: hypothetical protein O3A55_03455 [Bacteroidetes bacterium]|nr:hypothetical protein [Bacteroidota bacterium]
MHYNFSTLIIFSILFLSCDIFSTRTPEDPLIEGNTNPPATTPQLVISNFISSLQNKNILDYESLFSDTLQGGRLFKFNPTSSAKNRFGNLFQDWNKYSEKQFITKLFSSLNKSSSPNLTLSSSLYEYTYSDSARFSSNYILTVNHNSTSISTKFNGKFYLLLSKNKSNIWSISTWDDFESSKDSSFSDCKGAFSQ